LSKKIPLKTRFIKEYSIKVKDKKGRVVVKNKDLSSVSRADGLVFQGNQIFHV